MINTIFLVVGRSGDSELFDEWVVAAYSENSQAEMHRTRAQKEADKARVKLRDSASPYSTLDIELQNIYDPCMSFEFGEVWYEIREMKLFTHFKQYTLSA